MPHLARILYLYGEIQPRTMTSRSGRRLPPASKSVVEVCGRGVTLSMLRQIVYCYRRS